MRTELSINKSKNASFTLNFYNKLFSLREYILKYSILEQKLFHTKQKFLEQNRCRHLMKKYTKDRMTYLLVQFSYCCLILNVE